MKVFLKSCWYMVGWSNLDTGAHQRMNLLGIDVAAVQFSRLMDQMIAAEHAPA